MLLIQLIVFLFEFVKSNCDFGWITQRLTLVIISN